MRPTLTPPKIDGVLSPGEWDGAAHSDALTMVEPIEGGVPTERTEFWVTYDPDTIYVAPLVVILPGIFIFVTSVAFNTASDALREAMNTRLS